MKTFHYHHSLHNTSVLYLRIYVYLYIYGLWINRFDNLMKCPLLQSAYTRNQELSLVTERRENQLKLSQHIRLNELSASDAFNARALATFNFASTVCIKAYNRHYANVRPLCGFCILYADDGTGNV